MARESLNLYVLAILLNLIMAPSSWAEPEQVHVFHSAKDLNPSIPHWPEWICSDKSEPRIHVFCSDLGKSKTEGPKAALEA